MPHGASRGSPRWTRSSLRSRNRRHLVVGFLRHCHSFRRTNTCCVLSYSLDSLDYSHHDFYGTALVLLKIKIFALTRRFSDCTSRRQWPLPIIFLLIPDGTWAFVLIFGLPPLTLSANPPRSHQVTLCISVVSCWRRKPDRWNHRILMVSLNRVFRGCLCRA